MAEYFRLKNCIRHPPYTSHQASGFRQYAHPLVPNGSVHQSEIDPLLCFAPLLKWIVSHWISEDQVLFPALDATTLRQPFTVLSISLLVPDLPPFQVSPGGYAMRMWIEASFKFLKSATFH